MKICKKCKIEKDDSEFYKTRNGLKFGLRSKCIICFNSDANEYYSKHPGKRNEAVRKYRASHKEKWKSICTEYRFKYGPAYSMVKAAKCRARRKGLEFDLEVSSLLMPEYCPILGIKLVFAVSGSKWTPNSYSLDRIDNTRGYTLDNVIVCSWRANSLKKDSTFEELEKIYLFYKKLRDERNKKIGV